MHSAAVNVVIARGIDAVVAALERAQIPAPAYAVGLWGSGEEELDPAVICVGLEPDRAATLAAAAREPPRRAVWNVSEYAIELRATPDLRDDETFLAAEAQALDDLYDAGIDDPQQWVFNRIARTVGDRRPLGPVTDDFVVFAFHDGFGSELASNLRFSGGDAVLLLQAQALLPGE
jgi:hypothetical protein